MESGHINVLTIIEAKNGLCFFNVPQLIPSCLQWQLGNIKVESISHYLYKGGSPHWAIHPYLLQKTTPTYCSTCHGLKTKVSPCY